MSDMTTLRPSRFQLALAQTVVKAKPDGVTIRGGFRAIMRWRRVKRVLTGSEYILSLKDKISVRPAGNEYSTQTFLDGVHYWRSESYRLKSERDTLQGRIWELERRLDAHDISSSAQEGITISPSYIPTVQGARHSERSETRQNSSERRSHQEGIAHSLDSRFGCIESELKSCYASSLTTCRRVTSAPCLPNPRVPQADFL